MYKYPFSYTPHYLLKGVLLGVVSFSIFSSSGLVAQSPDSAKISPVVVEKPTADSRIHISSGDANEVVVKGDYTVSSADTVESIVITQGDLTVAGRINGDVVALNGNIYLKEGASVTGDVVALLGSVVNEGASVQGEVQSLGMKQIVEGVMRQNPHVAPAPPEPPVVHHHEHRRSGAWHDAGEALSTLIFALIVMLVGVVVVFFNKRSLPRVKEIISASSIRAGGVGLASMFLFFPVFVLLIVSLILTLVGIILIPVVVPGYFLLALSMVVVGLVAFAGNIGAETLRRTDGLSRFRSPAGQVVLGVGLLFAPLMAAHLLDIAGVFDFLTVLSYMAAISWIIISCIIGFGASVLYLIERLKSRNNEDVSDETLYLPE